MQKTLFLALLGLAAACAQPAEEDTSQPLLEEGPGGSVDAGGCADPDSFDLVEFTADILPILGGEIDLNHPDDPSLVGCARGPCHGTERPGGFSLAGTPEEDLASFACFVNLQKPKKSPILTCPTGECYLGAHPGGVLFDPPGDLNHDRILDFIRDSRP